MRLTVLFAVVGALIGLTIGIGGYTFAYAKGVTYLTNDPAACANCHAMSQYHTGWMRGAHRSAAVCNDCHVPHELTGKYATKAANGVRHSYYFTSGRYPDTPQITERTREILEQACRRCHAELVQEIDTVPAHARAAEVSCLRCHPDVGHM